jgi:hypothetical protein
MDARPGLDATLKALRKGDTLVVWKLDRLGRNLRHLVNTVHDLTKQDVGFKVLTGHGASIDTTTPAGKFGFMSPMHFTPEKECYSVLFLHFFRKALPPPTTKAPRAEGEGTRTLRRLSRPSDVSKSINEAPHTCLPVVAATAIAIMTCDQDNGTAATVWTLIRPENHAP